MICTSHFNLLHVHAILFVLIKICAVFYILIYLLSNVLISIIKCAFIEIAMFVHVFQLLYMCYFYTIVISLSVQKLTRAYVILLLCLPTENKAYLILSYLKKQDSTKMMWVDFAAVPYLCFCMSKMHIFWLHSTYQWTVALR